VFKINPTGLFFFSEFFWGSGAGGSGYLVLNDWFYLVLNVVPSREWVLNDSGSHVLYPAGAGYCMVLYPAGAGY